MLKPASRLLFVLALALIATAAAAANDAAGRVGELHRVIADPTAALRDAGHDPHARMTVWYPAADDAVEAPIVLGPPGKALFDGGRAAPDAPWRAGAKRYPLILLSHGFGGSARGMAWLGTALARRGYVVAAVDHPGNNGLDKMTLTGASLWWLRAEDLRAARAAVGVDPMLAAHVDLARSGVAGFSIGGYTSLVLAGARPAPEAYRRHCETHADDGVCLPQKELPELDPRHPPAGSLDLWRDNPPPRHRGTPVKAVFVIAPAVISGLDPASLRTLRLPTAIVLGDADTIATPRYNGEALARLLPRATLTVIPRVNHYDFLDHCTPAGRIALSELCRPSGDDTQAIAHQIAIGRALALFDATLRQVRFPRERARGSVGRRGR